MAERSKHTAANLVPLDPDRQRGRLESGKPVCDRFLGCSFFCLSRCEWDVQLLHLDNPLTTVSNFSKTTEPKRLTQISFQLRFHKFQRVRYAVTT
jgi:hypothetical protein